MRWIQNSLLLDARFLDQLQDNLKDCSRRYDSNLSGYRYGSRISESWSGMYILKEGSLEDAVNEGVRQGYVEGSLENPVVGDPIIRENTKITHRQSYITVLFRGDKVEIKVAPERSSEVKI